MYLKPFIKETISEVMPNLPGAEEDSLYIMACQYLFDNAMFHAPWRFDETAGDIFVEGEVSLLGERLAFFLTHRNDSPAEKEELLIQKIRESFPVTADRLAAFKDAWEWNGQADGRYSAIDYLAANLEMEVHLMDDSQLREFAEKMLYRTRCCATNYFADFALWVKVTAGDTRYTADLFIGSRGERTATTAYTLEQIVKLHYYTFNREYLEEQGLYSKAAGDPEIAHCLLYLSLHLICALRDTDLARLPRPKLPEEAAALLARIADGTYTEEEARQITRSMMESLDRIHLVPNKTRRYKNIPEVFLRVPPDLEGHFGILFAICECFCQMQDTPFFRPVKRLSSIRRTLGEEVAAVFEGRGACPTAFAKSFMQLLGIIGSQNGELDGPGYAVFALMLVIRVRSHKGGYGTFASSTFVYLRDCAMGTLDPETVISNCFKRGVMACHLGHFLSLITNKEYEALNFSQQTILIKDLGLTTLEAEKAMDIYKQAMNSAEKHMREILSHLDPDQRNEAVKTAMKNLFTRVAPGKDADVLCFVAALERPCPHPEMSTCLSCPYRIDTRATLYHAVRELRRYRKLRDQARTEGERMKYELLSENYIIPLLAQASMAALEMFGEEGQAEVDGIITQALEDDTKEEE